MDTFILLPAIVTWVVVLSLLGGFALVQIIEHHLP